MKRKTRVHRADSGDIHVQPNTTWGISVKGYFARYLNETGAPVGAINPAVPQAKPNAGKLANVFRYEDDSLVAANIIVSQFVKTRVDGKKLSQSVLSQTAYANLDMPSSSKNPHEHKGFYIEYCE